MRAVVLDRRSRVLLQAYRDPSVHRPGGRPHANPVWIVPGGGLAADEDASAGLVRELLEETGLRDVGWGPWLWRRSVDLVYQGRVRRFEERYRLGTIERQAPPVRPVALEQHERSVLLGHHWWCLADLAAYTGTVYPPRLAARLREVLAGHVPTTEVDITSEG